VTVGGIVLAGGHSTRMGADKATLDWHGRPLVAHVAALVAEATQGPVVVVTAGGQTLPDLPFELVKDRHPERGPLEGLATGLQALAGRADAAFAAATDMPLMTAPVIAKLIAALKPEDDAVAPIEDGRPLPLGAVYRTTLAATAARRAEGTDRSLRSMLNAVSTRIVELDDDELATLASLDTPGAYARALRSSAGRSC
jgi:molybdopterin-guanine dinucleotide biosynthesis protein A